MCKETLKAMKGACGAGNQGNLSQLIYIAYMDAVATIPAADVDTKVISADITMRPADAAANPPLAAGVYYTFEISQFDSNYQPEAQGDVENVSYMHKAQFRVNQMTAEKNHTFEGMLGRRLSVILPDGNEVQWLFGDKKRGAYIKPVPESADKNGYVCEVTYKRSGLLDEYRGAIPTA